MRQHSELLRKHGSPRFPGPNATYQPLSLPLDKTNSQSDTRSPLSPTRQPPLQSHGQGSHLSALPQPLHPASGLICFFNLELNVLVSKMESTGQGTCVVCPLFKGTPGQQGRVLNGKWKPGHTLTLHSLDAKAFAWWLSTEVLRAATCLFGCISDGKSCSLRGAQQGCNCRENRNVVQTERLPIRLFLCLNGSFAKLRGGRGQCQGRWGRCVSRNATWLCGFSGSVWGPWSSPTTGDKSFLYCPWCKHYMSCLCVA